MRRRFELVLMGVLLVAVGTSGVMPRTAALAAIPAQSDHASGLLYRWKFPASGHTGAWTFNNGVLSYDGESNATLFAPFQLTHVANFALQATIQGLGSGGPEDRLIGFGLAVRQKSSNPHTQIAGGSFFSSDSEDNGPEIYWNRDTVGGAAFDPKTSWHLYRLEVHGSPGTHLWVTLLIDGQKVVEYTIGDYPYPTRLGIFSRYYKIAVKNLQVLALSAPVVPPPAFPPTKKFNLTVSDLPTTGFYEPTVRHFYPNDEVARERGVSLADLEATGRIVAYGADFFAHDPAYIDLYSSVTAFKTPTDARADVPSRLQAFRKQFSTFRNVHDLPALHLGEASAGLSFDFDAGGASFTLLTLYFSRGSHTGLVRSTIYAGTLTFDGLLSQTLDLAKIVDQRLSAISH